MERKKTINIYALIVSCLVIVVCWIVFYNYKSPSQRIKNSETKKSPSNSFFPSFPPPKSFPIDGIPDKREDIFNKLTLEEKKESKKLTSHEEKTIIESLASQVSIDKGKTFFDYKWGFGMVPGNREIFSDGDQALYLFTDKGNFFVKVNNFSDLSRFEYEKESMLAINEALSGFAPHPLCLGNLPSGGKFLAVNFIKSRWHDRLIIENQKLLAKNLAQLHQKKSPNGKFGFHTSKNNQWKDNWVTFFCENRWQPMWKRIWEKHPHNEELKKWGEIIEKKVIPDLLDNLPIEPVLIHGNLDFDSWDINSQTKQPWVFDAHSYYGHNEIDLSLIRYHWFPNKLPNHCAGEFSESEFLAEYQKYHSLPAGFEKRRDLYRLYDYLHRRVACRGYKEREKCLKKALSMMKKLGQKYG